MKEQREQRYVMLEIKEYAKHNESDVKDLLVELQKHLTSLDKR